MAKTLFSDDDFNKVIEVGSTIGFEKTIKKVRIDLTWEGEPRIDLDICAFLLKDHKIHKREDLVFFGSKNRWRTTKPLTDESFDAEDVLNGNACTFAEDKRKYGYNNPLAWMDDTLPLSGDGSVIGSWDDKGDPEPGELSGEAIHVQLDKVDVEMCDSIVIAAAVSKEYIVEGKTFADAKSPTVTVYNAENGKTLGTYKLSTMFPDNDSVCLCKLAYDEDEWTWDFVALAESQDGYTGGIQFLARDVFEPTTNSYERY